MKNLYPIKNQAGILDRKKPDRKDTNVWYFSPAQYHSADKWQGEKVFQHNAFLFCKQATGSIDEIW